MSTSKIPASRQILTNPDYELQELIGRGGMGKVFTATEVKTGRQVAVKFLRSRFVSKKRIVDRFYHEANLAKSIQHPNICRVFDVDEEVDGTPYFVMELLRGRTLADELELAGGGPLMLPKAIGLAHQILSALEEAHRLRIVHRDLKPSNIHISETEDKKVTVKLLDFGISKILDQDTDSITQSDVPVGTPYYMAPEQASGEVSDHRVDIFAVGVILYEMMTGRRPFIDDDSKAIMYKQTSKPPKSPRRINPTLSQAMEKVILKALRRDPHKRYSSADEMRRALEKLTPSTLWKREAKETADVTAQDIQRSSMYIKSLRAENSSSEGHGKIFFIAAAIFVTMALVAAALWWFW